MDYEKLIKTVSEILENENIYKIGLILEYQLQELEHKKMQERFFIMSNPTSAQVVYSDNFEVEIGGILIRFIKIKPL
jgi:hypothetical protein